MQAKSLLILTAALILAANPALHAAKQAAANSAKTENQTAKSVQKNNAKSRSQQTSALAIEPEFPETPKLQVSPETIRLRVGETQTIKVPDQKDTPARNWSSDPTVATFENNTLRALSPGRALLSVVLDGKYATIPVLVTQTLAEPFPKTDDTHPIDAIVNKNLRELGILPSPPCTDEQFLRRVCIDLMGALPSAEQTRRFIQNPSPGKRAELVEWIFQQEQYADYWTNKWADLLRVKSEFPSNLWPNGVQAYHAWLRASVAANKPYDQLARELLNTSGSNFRDPAVNFYRAFQKRNAANIAESVALIFMGIRFSCTECTEHPFETWSRLWLDTYSTFFTGIRYKKTGEWKEEIVYFTNWVPYKSPKTEKFIAPYLPGKGVIPFARTKNPREIFTDWLVAPENPYFARHIANRYWAALFGRGITNPVDDVRPSNPPSNPELLDYLAKYVTDNKYDLRDLLRHIVASRTYQRSSETNPTNKNDTQNYSHYKVRRLDAEILADAIGTITGTYESFHSRTPEPYAYWPSNFRSMQNPDGSVTTPFLENFGRPGRDTSLANDRDSKASLSQSLYLLSSDTFAKKIENKRGTLTTLITKHAKDPGTLIDECYLSILNRYPSESEKSKVTRFFSNTTNKTQAAQDLVWALFNTKEFLYNH